MASLKGCLNIHRVFPLLQIFGSITCTWPHDPAAGKLRLFLKDLNWSFSLFNVFIIVWTPLVVGAYHHRHNVAGMMRDLSEATALSEVFCNLLICRLKSAQIKRLIDEVKNFLSASDDHEKIILQKYIDRYVGFYIFCTISHAAAVVVFSSGPIFLSAKLPTEGLYPFPIEMPFVTCIIYAMQVYSILQTGLGIFVDFAFSMLISYASARLEMLSLEIQEAKNDGQIRSCIKKHQEIISFVERTARAMQYILFKSNVTMGLSAIFGAFPLIRRQSLGISSQFICMVLGGCQRLFITAWPADDLKQNSQQLAGAVYNTIWLGQSRSISRNMHFMMLRSQKPLSIRMGGLLPALSLEYYAKFLIAISSYFATMRAVIGD